MTHDISTALDRAIAELPTRYPGPGGAVAVLKDSAVLEHRVWGFADAEQRRLVTPATLFRICSISKQFVVALLLDSFADPGVLDGRIRDVLRALEEPAPGVMHLCHNQSGLRDYWAVAMLQGASAEDGFSDRDAQAIYAGTRTLQFRPGTQFSYANQNFRLLGDLIAEAADEDLGGLLRRRIFNAVGMEHAFYAPDTRAVPDGTRGYDGDVASGFRPAVNNIRLGGDAAIVASLDDMVAWERRIDGDRDNPDALTGRLMAPVSFADGRPASYGFGLSRRGERGQRWLGHGGGLRGWRSQRLYLPEHRLSVVVLFNHMADAGAAALEIALAAVGAQAAVRTPRDGGGPAWDGAYLDLQRRLLARIESCPNNQIRLAYGQAPEMLALDRDGAASSLTRLTPSPGGLWMRREGDNSQAELARCTGAPRLDLAGLYDCAELGSGLQIVESGGVLYGALAGRLGPGRMEQLVPAGDDVWSLPCPRALDYFPPGDWTLVVRRGARGEPVAVSVGCWLAHGLNYRRVSGRGRPPDLSPLTPAALASTGVHR